MSYELGMTRNKGCCGISEDSKCISFHREGLREHQLNTVIQNIRFMNFEYSGITPSSYSSVIFLFNMPSLAVIYSNDLMTCN
jgi:hypothetical protein